MSFCLLIKVFWYWFNWLPVYVLQCMFIPQTNEVLYVFVYFKWYKYPICMYKLSSNQFICRIYLYLCILHSRLDKSVPGRTFYLFLGQEQESATMKHILTHPLYTLSLINGFVREWVITLFTPPQWHHLTGKFNITCSGTLTRTLDFFLWFTFIKSIILLLHILDH